MAEGVGPDRGTGIDKSVSSEPLAADGPSRPILLNSIEDMISRPDLGDRAIFLTLPPIADRDRRPERRFWQEFEAARPRILGSLLDGVCLGLRKLPDMHLEQLPRTADLALWATACETAFCPAGTFMRAYQANRRAAVEDLIEADPVAARVREIMVDRRTWTGSASDLFRAGANPPGHGLWNGHTAWPKSPRALAGRLRRAQTFLRTMGIEMTFRREGRGGTRTIKLSSGSKNRSSFSQ
jgi:hypothetical protein